jgi:prephenate dehydrogenase
MVKGPAGTQAMPSGTAGGSGAADAVSAGGGGGAGGGGTGAAVSAGTTVAGTALAALGSAAGASRAGSRAEQAATSAAATQAVIRGRTMAASYEAGRQKAKGRPRGPAILLRVAMSTLALLGHGRFGASLAALFQEAGHAVRAFDPDAAVPDALRAGSPADLVHGADFVALAVPVPRVGEALAALRPHLGPAHVVFDVGSVKVGPVAAMAAALGREVPWVGTHPLFGPVSLVRGERPLRAVVCPSPLHPAAAAAVSALFARIGCEVLEQDADAHDRAMAWTHALAFFVAKGMLDAGAPTDVAFAPPSFHAIARTIESVRADAGHLYGALHRENPYAGDARRALLGALTAADQGLRAPEEAGRAEGVGGLGSGSGGGGGMGIPDLGAVSPALSEARELIDEVDRELLDLLARRARLSRRAAAAKADLGAPVRDARREAALLEARRREAALLGLDPEAVGGIFEAVLRFSRGVQGR